MKNRFFTIILIVLAAIEICCQSDERISEIDFFELIKNPDYIRTITTKINENEITLIYYEFYMQDVEIGQGCIFAISKKIPQDWTNEAIQSPKGDCNVNGKKRLFYINCAARKGFTDNKENLIKEFEIYTFFIDKKDLEGPFEETSEFGGAEYYNEKPDSKVMIYKYESGSWVEKEKQNIGDEIPRTFGSQYLEKLVKERIK